MAEPDYLGIPGAQKHIVETKLGRIAHIVAGEGPPLVLLHGLGTTSETWYGNIGPLAQQHTVYAPDLWGHGDSQGPEALTRVAPLVEAFHQWWERMGLERAALLGHSLGGYVAMRFALEHEHLLTKLVLVDAGGIGRELSWLMRLSSFPAIGRLVFAPAILAVKRYGRRAFTPPGDVDIDFLKSLHRSRVNHVTANVVRRAVESSVRLIGPVSDAYLLPRMAEIDVPLMIIWGEQDRLFPAGQLEGVRSACPGVEIHVLSDVGHWPYAEATREFNALVLRFLGG